MCVSLLEIDCDCTGCSHAVVPIGKATLMAIALLDSNASIVTHLRTDSLDQISRFYFNETKQILNNSFCQVASLEVYRGKEQAIEISHDGFSLNDDGNIEVNSIRIFDYSDCYDCFSLTLAQ